MLLQQVHFLQLMPLQEEEILRQTQFLPSQRNLFYKEQIEANAAT